jgi:hypothetical protein
LSTPLRGSETNVEDPGESSALRDIHRWVTDRAKYIGVQVKNLIYRADDAKPEIIEGKILKSLAHSTNSDILDSPWMNELREEIAKLLIRNRRQGMPESCEVGPVDVAQYQTCIRGRLLQYWSAFS